MIVANLNKIGHTLKLYIIMYYYAYIWIVWKILSKRVPGASRIDARFKLPDDNLLKLFDQTLSGFLRSVGYFLPELKSLDAPQCFL